MNHVIHTGYNRAFNWIRTNNIRFIGYLTEKKQLTPDGDTLRSLFKDCRCFSDFVDIVTGWNGVFSVIVELNNEVYAASDPTRFFPLFYFRKDDRLILSDDVSFVRKETGTEELDPLALTEFLTAAFTCDDRTLFRKVKQITSAEAVCFSRGKTERQHFFTLAKKDRPGNALSREELMAEARQKIDKAFRRILLPLNDKPVLLPLSGGIDSRLIACKLKELGFTQVICFTYGKPGAETRISERVAEKLGFKWYFVEYREDLIRDLTKDTLFTGYYPYASRGHSMFYLQEYPAIKWLAEQKIITKDHVVLPGHPGDLLRGSLILKKIRDPEKTGLLAGMLLRKKFIHHRITRHEKEQLRKALRLKLDQLGGKELLAYSVQEDWELKERTSKYIINSSHAFTFFNLPCYFPLADKELMTFFRDLPLSLRWHGKLYQETLYRFYFSPGDLDFSDDIQPSSRDLLMNNLKKRLRPFLPFAFKQKLLRKNDWIAYDPMTRELLKELHANGIFPKETGNSYLYRILHWYVRKVSMSEEQ